MPPLASIKQFNHIVMKTCNTQKDSDKSPWWVIVLKVVAYALGLILAGYGTASAASLIH